jgi:23S rRNA G2445 N2-methylase RlmL
VSITIIARTVHGLEWICADETRQTFAPDTFAIGLSRRELTFTLPRLDPRLLELRTVDDLFVSVGQVDDVGTTKDVPAGVAARAQRLPFAARIADLARVRQLPERPNFDVVASLEGRRNYNRFALEGAVGRRLENILGATFLERDQDGRAGGESDLTVRLFVRDSTMRVALRLTARPLHRRPYKQDTGPGTIHPALAAALARLVAARSPRVLLDPFCGDGTILIESALTYPDAVVVGADLDLSRLANARGNAARTGIVSHLVRADVARGPWWDASVDTVITNPPWNLAVDAGGGLRGSLRPLWGELARVLTDDGQLSAVLDADLNAPATLARLGWRTALSVQIRLAGRPSHLILAAPKGHPVPVLTDDQASWRARAIAAGVVTEEGF